MTNYKSIKKIKSEMSVTNHHKLGLFEQKPLVLSAGYGKTIDWLAKGVVNPVFNEGICGASWAFATADAIASAYKIKEGDLYELSQQQLISCAGTEYYNEGCNGGNTYTSMLYSTTNPL